MKRQWVRSVVLTAIFLFPLLLIFFNQKTNQVQLHSPQMVSDVSTTQVVKSQEDSTEKSEQAKDESKQGERPSNKPTDKGNKAQEKPAQKEKHTIVWGVDTASNVNQAFLQCIKDNYGEPSVFGRYLETKGDVSMGLTKEEVDLLHQQGIKILPIFNNFTEAVGYDKGIAEAKEAIANAQKLGIPKGVAIFADIEPTYPVDEAFIKGWVDTLANSPYKPGIYGVFTPDSKLSAAYQSAASNHKNVQDQTVLWSSNPDPGVTAKNKAPAFQPGAPKNMNISIWQYGIDGEACNIDTNLIQSTVLNKLW
ncbi:glycoside hydrolase domain-containing protein [Bacillus sp. AFS037270]|uniref:glycoside hydrolase domain-containing protein n=1 Tax=Bacillus sp. AFS037270 TaxID=2033499 RepID=UPI001C3F19D3|nr:glycoside hydrolase domain-containing protein [Bacillus sp. AFS037270]